MREGIPLPILIRGQGWKDSLLFFLDEQGKDIAGGKTNPVTKEKGLLNFSLPIYLGA